MGIQTKEINGAQVIRLLPGPVSGSDITAARDFIQRRLYEGQSIFILSIEQTHNGSFIACGLIAICAEEIHAGGGTLLLTVRSGKCDESVYDLCMAHGILIYDGENTAIVEATCNFFPEIDAVAACVAG
jgi:hypothetical protein